EIYVVPEFLTPMSFYIHDRSPPSAPPAKRLRQRRQQRIVDPRAIGFRDFLQKRSRRLGVQPTHDAVAQPDGVLAVGEVHRELACIPLRRLAPVLPIGARLLALGVLLQPLGPFPVRTRLPSELHLLSPLRLPEPSLQVFHQDSPRHPVYHQV